MHTEASFDFPCPHCEKVTRLTMRATSALPREVVADVVTAKALELEIGTFREEDPDVAAFREGARRLHPDVLRVAGITSLPPGYAVEGGTVKDPRPICSPAGSCEVARCGQCAACEEELRNAEAEAREAVEKAEAAAMELPPGYVVEGGGGGSTPFADPDVKITVTIEGAGGGKK